MASSVRGLSMEKDANCERADANSSGVTVKLLAAASSANFSAVLAASRRQRSKRKRSKFELMEMSMDGEGVAIVGVTAYVPVEKKLGKTALLLLAMTRFRIGMQAPSCRA